MQKVERITGVAMPLDRSDVDTDQIIPAVKRIALMIMSSDRDFTLWPKPGTELTVDLPGTSIRVPVVGGLGAWNAAVK